MSPIESSAACGDTTASASRFELMSTTTYGTRSPILGSARGSTAIARPATMADGGGMAPR